MSQLRTVVIFAHQCAPFHRPESTIGAQRPAQFAKYLPEFGWRAVVLCCDHRALDHGVAADENVDGQVVRALREGEADRSVIVPLRPLPWDGVLDRAWRRVQASNGTAGMVRRSVRKALTMAKFVTGDYSQAWQPVARRAAEAVARLARVDACVGEHSPDAGLFLGRWFSARYGVPWVADFRDPILRPFSPVARRIYRPIARYLVSTATRTINVTPYWSQLDEELFGIPSTTIPNGFDEDEFAHAGRSRNARFTVAFVGSVNQGMHPTVFFDGVRELCRLEGDRIVDEFRFVYRGHTSTRMAALAAAAGVERLCDIRSAVPREEALGIMIGADVLLLLSALTSPQENEYIVRGLYPGKVFEYFGARRPILCVPGDGGQLDELVLRTRTGQVLGTPDAIARYLSDALSYWRRGDGLPYAPDDAEVTRYSRRAGSRQLAEVLDAVVAEGMGQHNRRLDTRPNRVLEPIDVHGTVRR